MRLRFVVPVDVDLPTGGNVYDLAVTEVLRRTGHEVELVRCAPPELPGVLRSPWSGQVLVDGLLACRQPSAVASAEVGVLVHMPLALEIGLPAGRADELDRLERQALHAAVRVVSTSHWSARYLAEHHDLAEVAVAAPGVDAAEVVRGSEPPLFVHLAAVLPHKDQLGVMAALERVQDLPWRARLAGSVHRDPRYVAAVREAVIAAGLGDRVELTGAMPRDLAWAGADLALLPSKVESYGMVVTEALARGVPAIVSEGGPAEALGYAGDGQRPGAVVAAGDTGALARELARWLTDAAYRTRLRASALRRRDDLAGWETTARCIDLALTGG